MGRSFVQLNMDERRIIARMLVDQNRQRNYSLFISTL